MVTYTELAQDSNSDKRKNVRNKIDASVRMFGMPHQLLEHNDPRLGTGTDLGRTYAETFIVEAPSICIKPGIVRFLPGANDDERETYLNAIIGDAGDSGARGELMDVLNDPSTDNLQYYDHEGKYGSYMSGVNLLCHTMAALLGLDNVRVPWTERAVSFKTYDWKNYRLSDAFVSRGTDQETEEDDDNDETWVSRLVSAVSGAAGSIADAIETDDQYVKIYVYANVSFSDSMSNSTKSSMLESFTATIEGMAKELSMIVGTAGMASDYEELVGDVSSSIEQYTASLSGNSSWMAGLLNRLGTGAKQVIQGGNFQIPEIYSNSSYDKNYSFTMTLATPYGNKLAWYINIGVPLCHLLGLALPLQLSANTYKSPFLLKCFSQGWFNCSLGIVDSISIDKGGDQSWNVYSLPNEVRVSISIKDLYSTLTLPANRSQFIANSGMMEFLMVNCGLDITNQKLSTKWKVWIALLSDMIQDKVTTTTYNIGSGIRDAIADKLLLFN